MDNDGCIEGGSFSEMPDDNHFKRRRRMDNIQVTSTGAPQASQIKIIHRNASSRTSEAGL